MADDIHTCSYYCDRPACIKAQRDELRAERDQLDKIASDAVAVNERQAQAMSKLEAERDRLRAALLQLVCILDDDQLRDSDLEDARAALAGPGEQP